MSESLRMIINMKKDPELQRVLPGLSLSMYLVTVLRNLLIILAVSSDSHFHTPVYFFLSNLCWVDIGFTSAMVSKMIVDMQSHSRVISYAGCLTRMSFLVLFTCIEDMLLTLMAYDGFVAICRPLHYPVIVNPHFCVFLVLVSFFLSLLDSQLHSWIVLQFTFLKNVEISHFVCEPSQLLNLACSDSVINSIFIYLDSTMFGFLPISGILLSYSNIVLSILRISSSDGKSEAFSICGSHLAVVCLFYGTGIGMYLTSAVSPPPRSGVVASGMYTVVTPMLNPLIYCLRNRDIQKFMWNFFINCI
nr:olfactory receptor 7E24-like [Pongo abelii]XP_054375076.1 olfactory receptor 7E24-like [Pongo abelii]